MTVSPAGSLWTEDFSSCGGKHGTAGCSADHGNIQRSFPGRNQAPAKAGEVTGLKVFGFKTGAEEGAIPTLIEQFNKGKTRIFMWFL